MPKHPDKANAGRPNDGPALMRIGELASKTDTTLRTLHYYEELGLIEPAERTKGGFRLYRPDATRHVRYIQYLRGLGVGLPQIQSLVEARASDGTARCDCVRGVLRGELRRVQSMMHQYTRLRDELESTLDVLQECVDRDCDETPGSARCGDCDVTAQRIYIPATFTADPSL
ncbi:MerR family transcriptional regulator [Candidatus Poribacteria bacterium]|nr:MerR family transcriptional regulator [Candidatus Poribacteria bacterium]